MMVQARPAGQTIAMGGIIPAWTTIGALTQHNRSSWETSGMKTTDGMRANNEDCLDVNSPKFFKQVAIGIAISAPLIALIQWNVHEFSTDDSYKCRNVSREECESMKKAEAMLRERMRQSTISDAKVVPKGGGGSAQ